MRARQDDRRAARRVRVGHFELQARIRDVAAGAITLREALDSHPLLDEAQRRVAAYADRILFVTGSGAHTNVPAIADVTRRYEGQPIALFVDYVQKVPVFPAVPLERERVGQVIESLKQLALDQKLAVVAITAADQEGLDARRLHLRHFRGSTALAYEADAVVVLNEKLAVVSRAHLAHSPTRAEEFHRQIVFSVEKNRNGAPDVERRVREGLRPLPLSPARPLGGRTALDRRVGRIMSSQDAFLAAGRAGHRPAIPFGPSSLSRDGHSPSR